MGEVENWLLTCVTPNGNYQGNAMKKTPKPAVVSVHPRAQVIITGKPLLPAQIETVRKLTGPGFCVSNWFNNDGAIGHLDSVEPGTTLEKFKEDWSKLVDCLFLDLGITLMNGPPGTPVIPLVSYSLRHGTLSRQADVHYSHPPPRRFKKTS